MFKRILGFFRTSASYVWLIVLAVYFSVLTAQTVLRSYDAQQETQALQSQLQQDTQENVRLQALAVYYQTDDYKEKELRQDLLLKMPNEKVYALPESSPDKATQDLTDTTVASTSTSSQDDTSTLPYWQQWLQYVTSGKKTG